MDYGQMRKLKLAIVSERTRYHFQKPLENLETLEVFHFYKCAFPDMDVNQFKNLISYRSSSDLKQKLTALKPDLIQGLEPYYGYSRLRIPRKILPILSATREYCRKTKTPYFFHVLENIRPEKKYGYLAGKFMKSVARGYAKEAKFIYCLNEGAKKNIIDLGQQGKIKHGLWGIWGVDTNEFKPGAVKEKTILFVGKLNQQKGVADLVDALKMIDLKDFKIKIAGEGPLNAQIREKVGNSNLKGKVEILGVIPSHKIAKVFNDAYLFVSPYKSLPYSEEQIGMTNIEAMASGLPVVGYDSGSISEFVKNKKTGILVKEGNIRALADAIKLVIEDAKLHEEMSKNARNHVLDHFDTNKNVRILEKELLESL